METLSAEQMTDIHGQLFWGGFACGAGLIASIVAFGSPLPLTRWSIWTATATACGSLFY